MFGYVTKLLIPISSVLNISKEKTAKMFPNAIGVSTVDDGKHVFGSFISREQAFQLMLSTWNQQKTVLEKDQVDGVIGKVPEIEISEISVEDDSSCSISGNEGVILRQSHSPSPNPEECGEKVNPMTSSTSTTTSNANLEPAKNPANANRDRSQSVSRNMPSTIPSSIPSEIPLDTHNSTKMQSEFNLLYIGVALAILLAVISVLLLLKINNIQSRSDFHLYDFKQDENGDVEVYSEWLKWQNELKTKNIEEAESILNSNLKEVVKVSEFLLNFINFLIFSLRF